MADTISSTKKGHLSGNKAADLHGVPCSTLKNRLSGKVQCGVKPGAVPYLSKEEETELTTHLVCIANLGHRKILLTIEWPSKLLHRQVNPMESSFLKSPLKIKNNLSSSFLNASELLNGHNLAILHCIKKL